MVTEMVDWLAGLEVDLVHFVMDPISIGPEDVPIVFGLVLFPLFPMSPLESIVDAIGEARPELELGARKSYWVSLMWGTDGWGNAHV